MKSKKVLRISVIGVCAAMILSTVLLFSAPKSSATPDEWTEWSYNDFDDSEFRNNIVLNGIAGGDGYFTLESKVGWYDMNPINVTNPAYSNPGRRDGFGFAFDSKNNVAVLFGGKITGVPVLNDTWEYDYQTNTWTQIIADGMPGSPPPRTWCQMDYDSVNNVIVLWGGYGQTANLDDTWEYDVDAKTWSEIAPRDPPPHIGGYALAYDSQDNKILMTGTYETPPGGVLHLWAYDTSVDPPKWTERASTPYPRLGHDMAFNGQQMIVQGGGWGMAGEYDDTLIYDYGTDSWIRHDYTDDLTTFRPMFRTGNAMARYYNGVYDMNGQDAVGTYLEDIWYYVGTGYGGWSDVTPPGMEPKPTGRMRDRVVWDSYNECLILYGGYGASGRFNDTWVLCSGYASQGWYISKWNGEFYFDSGSPNTNWLNIWWNYTPGNQPAGTKLKFQLQGDNNSSPGDMSPGETSFGGPDGSPTTYYENPGEEIWDGLTYRRYIRYWAYLDGIPSQTPVFDDITITYDIAGPPFIKSTDPADNDIDVPLGENITIIFSEPMKTGTVTWTINPDPCPFPSDWEEQWTEGDTNLTLRHPTCPFTEKTKYMVTVLGGKDLDDLDLVDPYDLNPWNFTTLAIKPWLVDTHPADGEINVPWAENIIVNFSEPMDTGTVTWDIFVSPPPPPPPPTLTGEWGNGDTTLYLNHTTLFEECRVYTIVIDGKDLSGNQLDAGKGAPNPWSFTSFCDQPYVAARDPEVNTFDVPLDKNIIITFSEEMNTDTVDGNWTVSLNSWDDPHIDLGWSWTWEQNNSVLNISHSTLFTENTKYFVNVTYGEDLAGLKLNRTIALARWWFFTGFVSPWIWETDPDDTETGVLPDKDIIVTFSEQMNTGTFTWNIVPDPSPSNWGEAWTEGDTKVTLTHPDPFAIDTYCVNITHAEDLDGNPLDPSKGAPNPWCFTTKIGPVNNLRVERSLPNIIIKWDAMGGADKYCVYESPDRFAAWPWTLLGNVSAPATQFTHIGAHDDGITHFYIVRAFKGEESANSTMGMKAHLTFSQSTDPQLTDINWLSLPYNSIYKKASDIANELTEAKIRSVGKWDPSKQKAITYTYAKGKWRGKDFGISPGEGVFIAGLQTDFYWVVNGTDSAITLGFTYYSKHKKNINWISVPYTGIYNNATSIVIDIEGGLGGPPAKIIEVGRWNAATQTAERFYWDGAQWTGTDFTIQVGDGIYIQIIKSFIWPIQLLTPTVP